MKFCSATAKSFSEWQYNPPCTLGYHVFFVFHILHYVNSSQVGLAPEI